MALHRLIGIKIGVPIPTDLDHFYREIGLEGGDGSWGCADLKDQIQICEAPYRQVREIRVGCEQEQDLSEVAARLERLGVRSEHEQGALRVRDPLNHWDILIEPAPPFEVPAPPLRLNNRPGDRPRRGERAEVTVETKPRPPRRLGHVVVGTPHIDKTRELFVDGLGFRVSDSVAGIAHFLRCSTDHHNLLIQPGPVPYLNHYALEHDDIDALARAASLYVRAHGDAHVDGPGRHVVGGNVFWYMRDPSGTFFEYFTDMDVIASDEQWQPRQDWPLEGNWSIWGSSEPPEVFFQPNDIHDIIAGYNRENS